MDILKKFDLTTASGMKLIGIGLIVLLGVAVLASVFKGITGMSSYGTRMGGIGGGMMPSYPAYEEADSYGESKLSYRNVVTSPVPPMGGYTPGDDAEAYEVKEYSATIETGDSTRDCEEILALKSRTDVIFEHANEHEKGCTYTFKVKKESVEEVLALIKALDPRDLTENAYTIKREVNDYTSEIDILTEKLASLDTTLDEAILSYKNVTDLATRNGDVESLAKIIESKLAIVERLTALRMETAGALERIERAKGEALDRLAYTFFTVSVYERAYVDVDELKDSWKQEIEQFVREINRTVQDISIGVVSLLLLIVKFALYFVILLFVAKFGWMFAKRLWSL